MRGKSIPKSVLKSGVKLPELAKSASIPADLHKTTTATATVVVSSKGPTPQEELDACRPLLNLSNNLFIKTDRRRASPVMTRHYDVEIHCEEKQVPETDHRERVRQELSAVLKRSSGRTNGSDPTVSPREILSQDRQRSPSMRRIVSFSGTVHVEERDEETSSDDEDDDNADAVDNGAKSDAKKVVLSVSTSKDGNSGPRVACRRCGKKVYPMESLEPGPGQFYHDRCFRCDVCKTKLSLVTFCKSLQAINDPKVYCRPHQPRLDKVNRSLGPRDSFAFIMAMIPACLKTPNLNIERKIGEAIFPIVQFTILS